MLQVKDPQEVFDEIVKPLMEKVANDTGIELTDGHLEFQFRIFVLGEMFGVISTCLAQNIPIPKELWENPTVQSFVRGDVDDVVEIKNGVDVPFLPEQFTSDKPIILLP